MPRIKMQILVLRPNGELPHGIDLNVNIPSASDTAWQRAFLSPGALAEPWGQSTSKTLSEYKYMWTPNIGFPYQKNTKKFLFYIKVCE